VFKSLSNLRKKTEKVRSFNFRVLTNSGIVSGRKVLNDSLVKKNDPPGFGMHHAVIRYSNRHNILFKPQGFISGFSSPDEIIFIYKCQIPTTSKIELVSFGTIPA